ncbi:MAG: DUF2267 domain-containing protein [Archangiaceae bacterium]|nr:DUF2267 domain-containing protein [Archangiaceae bacterium]
MSLRAYCSDRVVVLAPDATVFEAARAMAHQRVGAVLVGRRKRLMGIATDRDLTSRCLARGLDPRRVALADVMTPEPLTVDVGRGAADAVALMQTWRVRRLVVLDKKGIAGLVTLDDLVLSSDVELDQVRAVVSAQVAAAAPGRAAGAALAVDPQRSNRRREARRQQTMRRFAGRVMAITGLADAQQALAAFEVVASGLAQRLTPREAEDFAAQLPRDFRRYLTARAGGPDRGVSRRSIETAIALRLDVSAARAAELASAVGSAITELVSPGEIADMVGQLPRSMRGLLEPRGGPAAH